MGYLTNTSDVTLDVLSGFQPESGVYTLIVNATDYAGNIAVEEVMFVVYSARSLKMDALKELESAFTLDPSDDDLIQAIEYLHMSLGDSRGLELGSEVIWIDELHLDEEKGADVFQYEQGAVDKLVAYLENEENDAFGLEDEIHDVMEKLYKADKLLAEYAIEEAEDNNGKPDDIEKAQELLEEAINYRETGYWETITDNAYDLLEEAWEKAMGSH